MFDYDDGNGVYDVVTREDHERWQEEAFYRQEEEDKQNMTKEEWDEKYNSCPY